MRQLTSKPYQFSQVLRLGLAMLVIISSLGWTVVSSSPVQARALAPAAAQNARTSPVTSKKVQPTDAGQVQFSSAAYTTTEGQAGTLITVNRTGSGSGAVTATVVVTDVTTTPADYQFASPSGSLDPTFNPGGSGPNNKFVDSIAVQPDSKILISGYFTAYNSVPITYLARLNPDGNLDPNFKFDGSKLSPGISNNSYISGVALQPDGKILIGGNFIGYSGFAYDYVLRLNSDGTLDTTFNLGSFGPNDHVDTVAVQPDNKILISGNFTSYNGTAITRSLIRLNTDGSLDNSFNFSYGAYIADIAIQRDGKILITAHPSVGNLLRLNPDGSIDDSFTVDRSITDGYAYGVDIQGDGKIVMVGSFKAPNVTTSENILRLNLDGSVDTNFNYSGSGCYIVAGPVAIQPDGKILVGYCSPYNGVNGNYIIRINAAENVNLSWADGDSSPRSFVITATDDTLYEPTETAQLSLTNLQGGVTAGSPVTATLSIVDNDSPSQLNIVSGSNQSTPISTTFTQPLKAQVLTQGGTPAGSVPVTFTAPASGPGGAFASGPAIYTGITDVSGYITTTALTANGLAGTYNITATATGIVTPTVFVLTNTVGTTSLSLVSSPNPAIAVISPTVTFTATVTPVIATGTVTFTEGATVLGTGNVVNGTAIFTTSSLVTGTHVISATYSGNANYAGASSPTVTQVISPYQPLVVTAVTDDGTGNTYGTLSYALIHVISTTNPVTITFALTQGNTITFTGSLTTSAIVKTNVVISGGTFGTTNRIILNGNGVSGDGLHLQGRNTLINLTIEKFGGREMVLDGTGNRMQGVVVIAS